MYLFNAAIFVAAIFSRKVNLMTKGRRKVFDEIGSWNLDKASKIVWVHCASLGEFEQGRSVIEEIKRKDEKAKIVLTFFSPSGYEVRKNYQGADYICYLPSDTKRNARRFVSTIKPDIAIFVKYEYWFNFLDELHRRGAKNYVVSAIFRPDMRFFKKSGGFFRKMLTLVDHFFVQNEDSARLLSSIGFDENVTVSGDTRFDRVSDIVNNAPQLPIVSRFAQGAKVVVCGSTWSADVDVLLPLMAKYQDVKFIVAPHEINESEIERLIKLSERPATRYTQKANPEATLMVIDCIGILSGVYAYGDIAYIGGGFGIGIHNILEAATWGLPVIFGPKYQKFAEAKELIGIGGAFSIDSYQSLAEHFEYVIENRDKIAKLAKNYVRENTGATKIIIDKVFN